MIGHADSFGCVVVVIMAEVQQARRGAPAPQLNKNKRRVAPTEDAHEEVPYDDTEDAPDPEAEADGEHAPQHQPQDQPIVRRPKPRAAAPAPITRSAARAQHPGGRNKAAPMETNDDEETLKEPEYPDDPTEAKKMRDEFESKRKTAIMRKRCTPSAPTKINIQDRKSEPAAIKLSQLNADLCDLEAKAAKSKDAKQAMYYVSHLYKGKIGPTIQVEGRLTATPRVSATYDTTNFTIEITDPVEQRNWSEMSRQFKKNFVKKAVENKWPYAGAAINKMVFRDFYLRGKIMDAELRERYADPDSLPADMVDPTTKQVIECYAPRIKAQLLMDKKERNKLATDVMDENDMQMNPYDLRAGNKVRMAIRMGYAYYKAIPGTTVPNEYGVPCKLALLKRLDTKEELTGGPIKRTRWAEDTEEPQTSPPNAPAPTNAPPTNVAAVNVPPPPPPPINVPPPVSVAPVETSVVIDNAMKDKIKEQVQATVATAASKPIPPLVQKPSAPPAAPAPVSK